jgi:hypothetical protein
LLFHHYSKSLAAAEKGTTQVHIEHSIPGVHIHFNKWAYRNYSRAVDQDINAPIPFSRQSKKLLYIFLMGHIADKCQRRGVLGEGLGNGGHGLIQILTRTAEQGQPRPLTGQTERGRAANPTPRSRNYYYSIVHTHTKNYSTPGNQSGNTLIAVAARNHMT